MAKTDQELKDDIKAYAKLIQDSMEELERRQNTKKPEKKTQLISDEVRAQFEMKRKKRKGIIA